MIEAVEGIILSEKDYGDSSKILDVYTKKHGLIGVISKGCKRIKSPLRSVSSKLTYGVFQLHYKENKLSTLISVDVIDNFKNIILDIKKVSYASFLLELTHQVARQNNHEDIYDLLINALTKINEGFDPMVIMNIIELKYLDYLGVMPVIDGCSMCGGTSSIATLSSLRGGYVCNKCRTNEKLVSEKTIKLIRMFYYVDISKISKLDIGFNEKNEINLFLDEYYDNYTGLYLKSKNFLKTLNKV